ncbi:MAG: VOC family protein [Melioribacteraceae bacterium]|nr:VOC family protein [Melioribacteraceae bacterium]
MESKKEINQEAKIIENEKERYQRSIDSLNKDIIELTEEKTILERNKEIASAEFFSILKNSYLDHVIIGTREIQSSIEFLEDKLGFTIKHGKKHKNGISNFFIEFEDSSEIEFISVQTPSDKLASDYESLLKNNQFGFQYAIRTNQLNHLKINPYNISEGFIEIYENKNYSTLSKKNIDLKLPFFFIQHHEQNYTKANHSNEAKGIFSVWLETSDIRKTVRKYIDYGFGAIDTVKVGSYKNKTVSMRNDHFELIIIDSNKDYISGITIGVKNITDFQSRIKEKFNIDSMIRSSIRGKSISLNPEVTKSIWFEFLEY